MNALQQLIIETVDERYPSDASFYRKFGFNSSRWSDFKAGRTDINNMKYERISSMVETLFTGFEMDLLKQAQSNNTTDVISEYKRLKTEFVDSLGDNRTDSISSTQFDNTEINNKLVIQHKDYKYLSVIELYENK